MIQMIASDRRAKSSQHLPIRAAVLGEIGLEPIVERGEPTIQLAFLTAEATYLRGMLPIIIVAVPGNEDFVLQCDLGVEGPIFADTHIVYIPTHVMNGVSPDEVSMGIVSAGKEWW